MPVDERTLAKLYDRSGKRWGDLFQYWLRIEQEMERDRRRVEDAHKDDGATRAKDLWDSMAIKNIGLGSKFVNYHAGG